ncbi:MarR family transcriptional regulator [Streptacidiphilus cavernicola]|uniref:MarR family transcriptional regulator n=1 Tax=Streptacidiphilus cavernicola TaxID=3342716 RepID=A0ABV6VY56_9ACTN
MSSVESEDEADPRGRRRLSTSVRESLRELSVQLSLLNTQVGARLKLKEVDVDCLDLISRHGPLSPGALARRAGLHPATTTGILDRLERGGWIVRERDPADRRAVLVRALRERSAELFHLYGGMTASMDALCDDYSAAELQLLIGFLRRTVDAGRAATDALAAD